MNNQDSNSSLEKFMRLMDAAGELNMEMQEGENLPEFLVRVGKEYTKQYGGIRAAELLSGRSSREFGAKEKELAVTLHLYDQNKKDEEPKAADVDYRNLKPKNIEEVRKELSKIVEKLAAAETAEKGHSDISMDNYHLEDASTNKDYVTEIKIQRGWDCPGHVIISSRIPTEKWWLEDPQSAKEQAEESRGLYNIEIQYGSMMEEFCKFLITSSPEIENKGPGYHCQSKFRSEFKFELEKAVEIAETIIKGTFHEMPANDFREVIKQNFMRPAE
jgi:hypothetical protein